MRDPSRGGLGQRCSRTPGRHRRAGEPGAPDAAATYLQEDATWFDCVQTELPAVNVPESAPLGATVIA